MFFMLYFQQQWRSILVSLTDFEEGPKNPLKGIPVNPVVSASYAQFGVDAGDENVGRLVMAYESRPIIRGDRLLW